MKLGTLRRWVPAWNTRPVRLIVVAIRWQISIVRPQGFSQYTSLPASAAMIDAGPCQRSPVATTTASMSGRARSSRKSWYSRQSSLPWRSSTSFLPASRRVACTSAIATHCTSGRPSIAVRTYLQRLPMPITPSVIRSLAAATVSRPRARADTIVGRATAAAVPAARNPRREWVGVGVERFVGGVGMVMGYGG